MNVSSCRRLRSVHDWCRPVGDVNGFVASGRAGLRIDQEFADDGVVQGDEPGSGIFVDEAVIVADAERTAQAEWQVPEGPHIRPRQAGLRLAGEDDRDDLSRRPVATARLD